MVGILVLVLLSEEGGSFFLCSPPPPCPACCVTGPPRLGCFEGRFQGRFLLISRDNPRSAVSPRQVGFSAWLPWESCLPQHVSHGLALTRPLLPLWGWKGEFPLPLWSYVDSEIPATW